MNELYKRPHLAGIVMPLVDLLRQDISWSDREKVAEALRVTVRHFDSMEAERQHLNGGAAGQANNFSVIGGAKL